MFLRDRYRARPTMLVRARRKAYFGRGPGALRVTFDRDMECQIMREAQLDGLPGAWRPIPRVAGVLIEVKFRDGAPKWLLSLIADLDLRRTAFSKYVGAAGQELRGTPNVPRQRDDEED